ncbi:MAG: DUF805 domain-containing protein [Proteobacteria bacterium]|nr:DUF805 domain-containing protein [Pseudomonadota bacterium]
MNWYFEVLRKYAVLNGRARRKEFWMFFLFNMIILFVLSFVRIDYIIELFHLAVMIPSIAVGVRRMQDTGHSGWWFFVPIVNLVFAVQAGQRGSNSFGPDPISSYTTSKHATEHQHTDRNIDDVKVEPETNQDVVRNTAPEKLTTEALHAQTQLAEIEEVSKELPASIASAEDGNKTKIWKEKDNRGTRQETYQEAVVFWLARNASKKLDPFILYTFDNEENARKALLDTGVVHRTGDSGKLICTETLTFGYYRRNDGKYEAILCGDDLARDLWVKTKECFLKYGGILNNEQEPIKDIRTVAQKSVTDIQKVKFLREDRTSDVGQTAIYRIHTAPDALTAKAFLEQNPISQKFFYLVVETPEGNYCRDIAGIYKE